MSDEKITVIHTVASLIPNSGVTPVIFSHLQHQIEGNITRVIVLHFEDAKQIIPSSSGEIISLTKPRSPWTQFRKFYMALDFLIKKEKRNGQKIVVHDHGLWLPSNLAASKAARRNQCPYVISSHGMLQPLAMQYASWKKKIAWRLYENRRLRRAACIHVTSYIEEQEVSKIIPHVKRANVPLGIKISPDDQISNCERREIIYVGRLHPLKGISLLLDAWQKTALPQWHLILIGPCDDTYKKIINHELEFLEINSSVTLTGALHGAEKDKFLQNAAALVLPSYSENFGMVIIEAFSHGLPVITTNATPWRDIPNHQCGWVVAPEPEALAGALQKVMKMQPHELRQMGSKGREWVCESFDIDIVTKKLNKVYEELLNE